MRILRCVFCFTLFLVAACDTAGPTPSTTGSFPDVTYRTPGTDRAVGATVLGEDHLAVYGLTEGRTAPTDGTNAFPLLLRLQPNGSIAANAVYRDQGYGRVTGAAALDDGLAVLTLTRGADNHGQGTPQLILYRTDRDGTRKDVLYTQSNASTPQQALRRTPDGGLSMIVRSFETGARLIELNASGSEVWTYQMPEGQDLRAVELAPDGDLFVLGASDAHAFAIARLAPNGDERWIRTYGDDTVGRRVQGFAIAGHGVAVLADRLRDGTATIHLTRFDGSGDIQWSRPYATGDVRATALAALGGDAFAVAWTEDRTPDQIGGDRAEILRLDAQGAVQSRHPFGPQEEGTTSVSDLLADAENGFVAVGSTGPERLGGFGGDDFDVLVQRFDQPQ